MLFNFRRSAVTVILSAGLVLAGCGSDENVTTVGTNQGTVSGTVNFASGGSANTVIVSVVPRATETTSNTAPTLENLRTVNANAIARGQLRTRAFQTSGLSSFTYEFRDLPTGDYFVLIKPTNLTGNGTGTESTLLSTGVRATTGTPNANIQLALNTAPPTSMDVTANPVSGVAPSVTFSQTLNGFTDNAPVGDVVVANFVLTAENSDRVFDLSYRTSTGPVSVINATFAQDGNWGSGNVRTLCYGLNEPDTEQTDLKPGNQRGVAAIYAYQR